MLMPIHKTSLDPSFEARALTDTPAARASTATLAVPTPNAPAAVGLAPGAARVATDEIRTGGRIKPNLRQSFSALRHRNFRLFWTGQMVSLIGTWTQVIARSWLVYQLAANTGQQGFWLGMVGVASSVPVLVLSLYAGVISDRVSKWRIIVTTQAASMILALILAALTFTGVVQIWHVLAISVLLGVVNAFDAPSRQAFVVEMVGKDDLVNAVALNSTVFNAARVLGPSIAGILLAVVGPAVCFLINGLSYIAVLIGLLMMHLPAFQPMPQTESAWRKLKEGLGYIRGDAVVLALLVLVGVNSFFGMTYSTLAPIFADNVLHAGESGYGLLMGAAGIGALIGALNLAVQSGRSDVRRGRLILFGGGVFSVALAGFALSGNFLLSLVMLAGVGWSMISLNATTNTVIQTSTPDHLRGRVMSVYALLFLGIAPAGSLLAGFLTDLWGAPAALFLNAVICGLTVFAIWRWQPRLLHVR
jgi:MFS family permease